MGAMARMRWGGRCVFLVVCVSLLCAQLSLGERFKLPGTRCGRLPNIYLCDDTPIGIEEKDLDNGQGRTPATCTPGAYCPYGEVTYGFGRNNLAQLGIGDFTNRLIPTPLATAYAKVDQLRCASQLPHTLHRLSVPWRGPDVHSLARRCGAAFNVLRWEGENNLYSWGDDRHGQLGLGGEINDTMPNRIFSVIRPVCDSARWEAGRDARAGVRVPRSSMQQKG